MISQQRVILVHGYDTTPNGGWFPWLMAELKKLAVFAVALDMPTPATPKQEEWVAEIARAVERHRGHDVYLVGHSLGCTAILFYLARESAERVKGVVLVSGRAEPPLHTATAPFYHQYDFVQARRNCHAFAVIHASDDHTSVYQNGIDLARALDVALVTVPTGGHLWGVDRVHELPEVMTALAALGFVSERKEDR